MNNITPKIKSLQNKELYLHNSHPIGITAKIISQFLSDEFDIKPIDISAKSSVVTFAENFTSLLIPNDHPSCSVSDTYYEDKDHVLRTHMTAYLSELSKLHSSYSI